MEKGMRPTNVRRFPIVAFVPVTMLLILNSQAPVDWTRQPQAGPGIEMLERPAVLWNELMKKAGTSEFLIAMKRRVKPMLDP